MYHCKWRFGWLEWQQFKTSCTFWQKKKSVFKKHTLLIFQYNTVVLPVLLFFGKLSKLWNRLTLPYISAIQLPLRWMAMLMDSFLQILQATNFLHSCDSFIFFQTTLWSFSSYIKKKKKTTTLKSIFHALLFIYVVSSHVISDLQSVKH